MLRRSLATLVVLFIAGSLVAAATVRGIITKVDKDEITVKHKKDPKDKDSETIETKVNIKDAKFFTGGGKKTKAEESSREKFVEAFEGATKDKGKGLFGSVEHEDGKATKVTFGGGKRKDKKDDK